MSNGKGDAPRPKSVPEAEYADRWERTFRRPPPPPEDVEERMRTLEAQGVFRTITNGVVRGARDRSHTE